VRGAPKAGSEEAVSATPPGLAHPTRPGTPGPPCPVWLILSVRPVQLDWSGPLGLARPDPIRPDLARPAWHTRHALSGLARSTQPVRSGRSAWPARTGLPAWYAGPACRPGVPVRRRRRTASVVPCDYADTPIDYALRGPAPRRG
jgi:hypothetical protein